MKVNWNQILENLSIIFEFGLINISKIPHGSKRKKYNVHSGSVSITLPSRVTHNYELSERPKPISKFFLELERFLQMLHQNSITVMILLHCIILENNSAMYIQQSLNKYCYLWQSVHVSVNCNSPGKILLQKNRLRLF